MYFHHPALAVGSQKHRTWYGMLIINTSPALVSKWCCKCSSWIQSLDMHITARYNGISQTGCPFRSIHWNWYCLVTMVLESQTVTLVVLESNYHRNIGGCVYLTPIAHRQRTSRPTTNWKDTFLYYPSLLAWYWRFLVHWRCTLCVSSPDSMHSLYHQFVLFTESLASHKRTCMRIIIEFLRTLQLSFSFLLILTNYWL